MIARCQTILLVCAAWFGGASAFAAINGTVQPVTFTGPVTGQSINFSLYLPPGYNSARTNHQGLIP